MKIKGLRWWIVGLVALATVINYLDRSALGILWSEIWPDIGLTEEGEKNVYATISLVFTITYGLSKGLSGRLYDIIGTRLGFVFSIVVWSVSAALHGLARGATSFVIFRGLLGVGEAGNWPGAAKSNAEWFPVKERALAQGIFNSGASIGAIISAPIIAWVFLQVGWQMTFILIGLLGLLWIIPWLYLNRALPEKHPFITEEEREYILSGAIPEGQEVAISEEDEKGLSWGQLLRYKQTWAIIISRFMLDPIWWIFVIWLPIYLNDAFGFNVKEIGASAWVPYVGAALGSIIGGWLTGVLIKRFNSVDRARKWVIGLAGLIMLPGLLYGAVADEPTKALLAISVVLFGFQVAIGNLQTLPSDYFSGKSVGTLAGLGGFSAAAGVALLSTYLVPWLSDDGNYYNVFIMAAALVPIGIAAIFFLGGKIQRVKLKD